MLFKNPTDIFKITSDFVQSLPKTPEDLKTTFEKIQAIFETEAKNTQEMWKIYNKASQGEASLNEIYKANKMAQELLKSTRFAMLMAIPGSVFLLPIIVEMAKEYDVDLVPASVTEQFEI